MARVWTWLQSDQSLAIRVAVGVSVFATLAIVDYRRNRAQATRWREYAFLLVCVAVAIAYGIANDLITSRISIEYFLFGKGVAERVSSEVATDPLAHRGALDLQAMRIGALATWSAGLLAGAMLLIANSVGSRPRLGMPRLARLLPWPIAGAIVCACVGGFLGSCGVFAPLSADFREMIARDEMRPLRYMSVFGVHLGGYIGGLIGLLISTARIVALRRKSPPPPA